MFQAIIEVPDEPFRLVLVSDLHIGLKSFRKDLWIKQLKELGAPNTYWISLGDVVEGRVGSDVKMYDPFVTEMTLQDQYDYYFESIEPFKDKCIGMILGNHETGHVKKFALNPIMQYCATNKINYYGDLGRVVLKNKHNTCRLLAFHGAGGGRMVGSAINRVTSFADNFLPDLVVSGHHHKPAWIMGSQPKELKNGTLIRCPRHEIITGSLMDGYTNGISSYAEQKMLDPTLCSYTVLGFDDTINLDSVRFIHD